MSPVRNLTDSQKLDLLLDHAVETKKTLVTHSKDISKVKTSIRIHKIILTGFGSVISVIMTSIVRTFFK